VPRWNGDNNHARRRQTRILPQSLELTWERLAKARLLSPKKAPAPASHRRKSTPPKPPPWTARIRSAPPAIFPCPLKPCTFPSTSPRLALCGIGEENIAHAERMLGVKLVTREDWLKIEPRRAAESRRNAFYFLHDAATRA